MSTNHSVFGRQQNNRSNKRKQQCRDIFGDKLSKDKDSNNVRFVFQNINGLQLEDNKEKKELIRDFINKYKVDFFAMAEVNVNWRIVQKKQNLHSLAKKWFEHSRVTTANNLITSSRKFHQQGGVAIIA